MTLQRPIFMQAAGGDPAIQYSATDLRAGLITPLLRSEGVFNPDQGWMLVTQRGAGANFSVDVASGWVAINGNDVSLQGVYMGFNTATLNVATPAAPGSGTQVHRVIARIKDKLNNGTWTTYEWTVEVLADTGSGTPAEPASAITLALVTITTGQASVTNANIADKRPWAVIGGCGSGTLTLASGWTATDASRPPSYLVTPDGEVRLHGYAQRSGSNLTATAGTFFDVVTGMPALITPTGNRDMVGVSSEDWIHYLVQTTNNLRFRCLTTTRTYTNGVSWISFEGVGWKLGA